LLIEVDKVAFVFGDGEVREHVDAAATAVRRRLEALSAADGIQRAGHPIDTLFVDRELDEDLPKNRRAQTRGLLRLSAMKQVKAVELLPRLRDTETQRINDFRTAAVRALRLAADEVDRLRADVDGERGESPALTPV
jgi:hypothetical protein